MEKKAFQANEAETSSEPNLGCESIDSSHAIIKMCTAFSHVSLSLQPPRDTSERRKHKMCARRLRAVCEKSLEASKHQMMKKINRSKRKGHVKLNVQDGEKVGRTLKNEVWLNFIVDIRFFLAFSSVFVIPRVYARREGKEKPEKGPQSSWRRPCHNLNLHSELTHKWIFAPFSKLHARVERMLNAIEAMLMLLRCLSVFIICNYTKLSFPSFLGSFFIFTHGSWHESNSAHWRLETQHYWRGSARKVHEWMRFGLRSGDRMANSCWRNRTCWSLWKIIYLRSTSRGFQSSYQKPNKN